MDLLKELKENKISLPESIEEWIMSDRSKARMVVFFAKLQGLMDEFNVEFNYRDDNQIDENDVNHNLGKKYIFDFNECSFETKEFFQLVNYDWNALLFPFDSDYTSTLGLQVENEHYTLKYIESFNEWFLRMNSK